MTVELERPRDAVATQHRSPIVAGVVAATWAAAVGLAFAVVVVLTAWVLGPHGDANPVDVVRAGVLAWLYANHGTLRLGASDVTLLPLGALLVPAVLLYRSGRWAGRVSVEAVPAALAATGSITLGYASGAGMLAASEQADARSAVLGAGLLAAVAAGLGVLSGAGLGVPARTVPVLRGAAAGLAVLLGCGAALLAATLVAHVGQADDVARSLQAGGVGGVALLMLGLLAVPTAVVWAAAYAVGPGFAVGVGTAVAPSGVALGPVPAFPLLAGLPGTGPAPTVSLLSLVAAPLAGVVVGLFAARRPSATPGRTAAAALAAGVLAGVALGALAWLSSGSLGAVRMSALGPDPLAVGGAAALEVGAVAAAVAYEAGRHRALLARAVRRLRRAR